LIIYFARKFDTYLIKKITKALQMLYFFVKFNFYTCRMLSYVYNIY